MSPAKICNLQFYRNQNFTLVKMSPAKNYKLQFSCKEKAWEGSSIIITITSVLVARGGPERANPARTGDTLRDGSLGDLQQEC